LGKEVSSRVADVELRLLVYPAAPIGDGGFAQFDERALKQKNPSSAATGGVDGILLPFLLAS
jgi:hypothetical protein